MRWWHWGILVWMSATMIAGFLVAPLAEKLEEYTRVLYFHVPAAWVSVIAFGVAAVFAWRYLAKRDPLDDARSRSAVQLGLVFCLLATLTGSIWAKAMWGAFWNWDPRQVSIFFLILIYGAYLTLRGAVEDPERRARLSSVYALFAFVTVPFLVFVAPRMSSFTLHPDPIVNEQAKLEMHPLMFAVFLSSMAAFTAVFFWMWAIDVRLSQAELEREEAEADEFLEEAIG